MTGRSVPPPLAIRGPLTDDRHFGTPEVMRFFDSLFRAGGGDKATVTQEIITRATESPVPVFQMVEAAQPVAVSVVNADPQPVALDTVSVEIIPVPLI